ncbi:Uncharacterised protein [Sphingobacterium spiritivorum]|uniref:Uncharacterized protein n=1 Tax=Sphingobacterium spiritivorum TaxID=258 RepID=A0A380CWY3_SPHSI|nr:Uncharacterised protein [Sphingobacterium spiritivorum]
MITFIMLIFREVAFRLQKTVVNGNSSFAESYKSEKGRSGSLIFLNQKKKDNNELVFLWIRINKFAV